MRHVTLALGLVLLQGCAATATVTTRDRKQTEALIIGGDRDHLLLQTPYGVEKAVRRTEVKDIDHPGNVLAILGGLLGGGSAMDLAVLGVICSQRGSSTGSSCPMLFGVMGAMTALGTGMFVYGLWTWLTSKNAVTDSLTNPPLPEALVTPAPVTPATPPPLPPTGPLVPSL